MRTTISIIVKSANSINIELANKVRPKPPTFKAHDGQINKIIVGNKYLATSSDDSSVKLWDLKKLTLLKTLKHKDPVDGIAFSPSEKLLLSADTKLRLWNLDTGKPVRSFDLQTDLVHQVKFRNEDSFIAIERRPSSNGAFQVVCSEWNVKTGKKSELDMGIDLSTFAISPDTNKVGAAYHNGSIKIYSLSEKKMVRELTGHRGLINFVSFLPNDKFLSSARDSTVRIWDIESDNSPDIIYEKFVPVYGFVNEEFGTYLAITFDGKLLAGVSGHIGGVSSTFERLKIFNQGKVFFSQWENQYNPLAKAIAFDKDTDSLLVAYSDGTKHRISLSEILESDSENTKSAKKETNLSWSNYQGKMFWDEAKDKCASISMRLPTIEELKMLYGSKLINDWQKDGSKYWSSTPSNGYWYYLDVSNGNASTLSGAAVLIPSMFVAFNKTYQNILEISEIIKFSSILQKTFTIYEG